VFVGVSRRHGKSSILDTASVSNQSTLVMHYE
jgi:hypothetical protein